MAKMGAPVVLAGVGVLCYRVLVRNARYPCHFLTGQTNHRITSLYDSQRPVHRIGDAAAAVTGLGKLPGAAAGPTQEAGA
jgi:hypothetical protein